ncbi:VPS9 domain-containing protein 1-like [Saccoglossus kowalevskii]|uniref:VPS9 domain-containing protein 1-like n=1 Tax=Saccoglossus kowalevskii TaxID=10224 RepID=A0ABM0LXB5_SACKO|nr:PREDICTED: VPS9 domain-containing protein 1-like [Saccoglossus kowalevskii]
MDSRRPPDTHLQYVMKEVGRALMLDSQNKNKEAYCQYLACIKTISQSLSEDAQNNDCENLSSASTQRMFKLAEQCIERVKSVADKIVDGSSNGQDQTPNEEDRSPPLNCGETNPPPYTPLPSLSSSAAAAAASSQSSRDQQSTYPLHPSGSSVPPSQPQELKGVDQDSPPDYQETNTLDLISMLPNVPGSETVTQSLPFMPMNVDQHSEAPSINAAQGQSLSSSIGGISGNVMLSYHTSLQAQQNANRRSTDPVVVPLRERMKTMSPLEKAYFENHQLIAAYKARMNRLYIKSSQDKTTVNLTLQRRLMENMAIARARQEALQKKIAERQARLQEEAALKFTSSLTAPTPEEVERRQVYANVMEFEHSNVWLNEWRIKLKCSPGSPNLINELVNQIVSCKEHPISQLLQKYQYNIYKKLYTIVQHNMHELEAVKIPYPGIEPIDFSVTETEDSPDHIEEIQIKERLIQETLDEMKSPEGRETISSMHVDMEGIIEQLKMAEIDRDNTGGSRIVSPDETATKDGDGVFPGVDENHDQDEDHNDNHGNGEDNSCMTMEGVIKSLHGDLEEAVSSGSKIMKQLSEQDDVDVKEDVDDAVSLNDVNKDSKCEEKNPGSKQNEIVTIADSKTAVTDGDCVGGLVSEKDEKRTAGILKDEQSSEIGIKENSIVDKPQDVKASLESKPETSNITCVERKKSSDSASSSDELTDDFSDELDVEGKIHKMHSAALKRHLKDVTKDVHKYLDKLQTMFMIIYEDLNTPVGKDQCIASVEKPFFQPVWPYLLTLFRLVNFDKEQLAAATMTRYINASPRHVGVRKKLCLLDSTELVLLDDSFYPYKSAVSEIKKILSYQSPLDKLECIVNTSRAICNCVEDYFEMLGKPRHGPDSAIGCDDLLPIFSFVIIKSQSPQLVSECSAMEEFIHEGYLFGEEGYCLTTLLTALSYICKLEEQNET